MAIRKGDEMNFKDRMKPVKKESVFSLYDEGFIVWCGTIAKGDDDLYYLYFSFWPIDKGHDGWVTHSKIGYATSKNPTGPFEFKGIALSGAGGDAWDRDCVHNPTVIKIDGKYYLYYMGNKGSGVYINNRNNQRVGVAYSDSPQGPFKRFDAPVIDVSQGDYDSLLTSNPAVVLKDEKIYMIYKAVSDKEAPLPKGGPVVCKIAISDNPLGGFVKTKEPIMRNPENPWSVEDPCIWYENDRFYSLVRDFHGYFTKTGVNSVALFESFDGIDWKASEQSLAFNTEINWEDGSVEELSRMERPQVLLDETGKPIVLTCACMRKDDKDWIKSFSVQIEIV